MIQTAGPVMQALLGTLMTWGITALGGACVVIMPFVAQLVGGPASNVERKVCILIKYFCLVG
jgi:hypothetical protein